MLNDIDYILNEIDNVTNVISYFFIYVLVAQLVSVQCRASC